MFNSLTIKTRLLLIVAFSAVLAITLGVLGLVGMQKSNEGLHSVYVARTVPLANLAEIKAKQLDIRLKIANAINDPEQITRSLEIIAKRREEITKTWEAYQQGSSTPEEKILANKFVEVRKVYASEALNPILELMKKGEMQAIDLLVIEKLRPLFAPVAETIDGLVQLQQDLAKQEYEQAVATYKRTVLIEIIALISGIAFTLFLGFMMIRNLMKQLGGEPKEVAGLVAKVAAGQLNNEIILQRGDTNSLLADIKAMQDGLSELVREIEALVGAAVQGDFSIKIDLSGKQGFGKTISSSLNQLSETTEVGLNDVMRVVRALAEGDLSQKITKDYPGVFGLTKNGVNHTVDSLTQIVGEIQHIVDAGANQGDFSIKMNTLDKEGYIKNLAELLNQLYIVTETGLDDVSRVVNALAQGDLTQTINKHYPGIFGQVKEAVNGTVGNLKNIIGEITDASNTISTAAKEIAAGNNDLSHRTEEQAASLEETAASMEELTSTVQANSANAKHASQLAVGATDIADKGVNVVGQVMSTMGDINESSRKIVDIISVIDDIAFQTNILALNAAVEAARAGEQGRGFAVVAIEVRNLAQRAAAAAAEIKGLIGDSVGKVEDGAKLVTQAGRTMEEIVSAIRSVTHIMSDISSASMEQTSGIEQVNQAIAQMDDVTQQNAALVEQAAAAAESLEEQTQNLTVTVSHFRLDGSSNGVSSRAQIKASGSFRSNSPQKESTSTRRVFVKSPAAVKLQSKDEWEEF